MNCACSRKAAARSDGRNRFRLNIFLSAAILGGSSENHILGAGSLLKDGNAAGLCVTDPPVSFCRGGTEDGIGSSL